MLAPMATRTRVSTLLAGAIILATLAGSAPASACSWAAPPDIADLEPGTALWEGAAPVVGVYEIEHLARSPRLLISGPRAVTGVTRYWGEAPALLGLEMTGMDAGLWAYSNCGDMTQPAGTVSYWYADEKSIERPDWGRSVQTLAGTDGSLTVEQEAMLVERFGPPVVLGTSAFDHVQARFMLWKWHLLALVIGTGLLLFVRRRHRVAAPEA